MAGEYVYWYIVRVPLDFIFIINFVCYILNFLNQTELKLNKSNNIKIFVTNYYYNVIIL